MKSLWEILVPTVKSVDPPKYYTTRYHQVWDAKVRQITGGLTITPPARGQWVAPDGELFIERMIPVRIICTQEQIDAIADMTASYYNQQAVMFYRLTDAVQIKHYPKADK
jgi:hypothetical protein